MIFLDDESEFKLLNTNQVLYFYANWMPFHKKMIIMLNKMEEKYKDVIFYAIDVDYFKKLCVRFSVKSIPEIILFKDGINKKNINGIILTSALKNIFSQIYS